VAFPDHCTALITGASAGLGHEFARQLAPRASRVVLVARRAERLHELESELRAAHPDLEVICRNVDLADEAQIGACIAWIQEQPWKINLLINNAGLGDHGTFASGEWPRLQQILDVNIRALTRLTHALLPSLQRQERAAIINISSIVSLVPVPGMAVYAASKAYVTSFSESLRAELRTKNVSVLAVCPGPVETEFGMVAQRQLGSDEMRSPDLLKVSPAQVVRESLRAMVRDRARIIPGRIIALVMTLACLTPLVILRFFLNRQARGLRD
jgi:short-subunit dehydrogenase